MFDVRLRLYNLDGSKSRVLKTLSLDVTPTDSGTARLSFTTSTRVAGYLESPFLIGVEYSDGGPWVEPRNNLFVATEESADAVDVAQAVAFVGVGFVPWLLQYWPVWWAWANPEGTITHPSIIDGVRHFDNQTAGQIMRQLITEGQGLGWAPLVDLDFTASTDSTGAAWAEMTTVEHRTFQTPLTRVLSGLSEQGYCEWWTEGTTLRMVNAGYGLDRTGVKLGGRGFTRAPLKRSFEVFTELMVIHDAGWEFISNPGADDRFGRLQAVMSQSGVSDPAVAVKNAQPALTQGRASKRELAYDWTVTDKTPRPWADFNIGDLVKVRDRSGWVTQRVIGFVVSKSTDGVVTCRAVAGSKLLTLTAKLAARSSAASVGTMIGGAGNALPSTTKPAAATPLAPTGVHVASNVGVWGDDGSARSVVTIGWDAVEQSTDMSWITVASYQVWEAAAGEWRLVATTDAPSVVVDSWLPGTEHTFRVRAIAADGRMGTWSSTAAVTAASPLSIVPKAPTGLAVTSNTAAFQADGSALATLRVQWDAVTFSVDDVPVVIDRYELWMLEGAVWAPVSASPSRDVLIPVPSGQARSFRVRAYTTLGVWSDFSATEDVVAADPGEITLAPTTPALTTSLGMVQAGWDGTLAGGVLPAGVAHVLVEHAPAPTGPWTRIAVPLPRGGGSSPIRGEVGAEMFVRLIPVDTLGREFTPSEVASIIVAGVTGPDIVANSITANHVELGSLTVAHMESGFGSQIDLGENQVIISITADQQAIADQAADTAEAVEELSAWFRVDVDGAHVGRSDSAFQAHVKPGRFEITENEVVTSHWEAGRMVVPSLVADEVVLANHKLERYGDGTVVRSLGI